MEEPIHFPKKQIDSNLEKVWEMMCERIRKDFTATGFSQYIDEFKKIFVLYLSNFRLIQ
jgi:hypothetical protein